MSAAPNDLVPGLAAQLAVHSHALAAALTGRSAEWGSSDLGIVHDRETLARVLADAPCGAVVVLGEPDGVEHVAHMGTDCWFVDGDPEPYETPALARLACEDSRLSVLEVLRWPL